MSRTCILTPALFPTESMSPEALRCWQLARDGAAAGDEMTVLYVSREPGYREKAQAARAIYRKFGVELVGLGSFQPLLAPDEKLDHSAACLALAALKKLHAEKNFTHVHVPVADGVGLRIAQSKRATRLWDNVDILFHLDGCGEWNRFERRSLAVTRNDVKTDFSEQETLSLAARSVTDSQHLRAFLSGIGWEVESLECIGRQSDAGLSRDHGSDQPVRGDTPCFLGDADGTPGFAEFLQVISVPKAIPQSIVVCETDAGAAGMREKVKTVVAKGGGRTSMSIPARWDQLPAKLRAQNAVVILPDGIAGPRVAWLASEGVPFVYPSTLADDHPKLRAYPGLAFVRGNAQSLLAALRVAAKVTDWEGVFRAALDTPNSEPSRKPQRVVASAKQRRVLVAVSHYNLGGLMEETLEALAGQDYSATDVLVVDDGSPDPDALEVFRKLAKKFSAFRFVERPHEGYWSPRNYAMKVCEASLLIVVDGDNLPVPHMTSVFVEAMERNPEYAACSSYISAFTETREEARAGRFTATHTPLGGDIVSGFFENVFGDTNSIFRIEAIRAIGGFRENFACTFGDWEIFQRLVARGYRMGVVPEVLLHYRRRRGGMIQTSPLFLNFNEILKVMELPAEMSYANRRRLAHALHGLALSNS